jgi:hypothetical protein
VQVRTFNGVRPYGSKAPWNIPVSKIPQHAQSATLSSALWADFAGLIPELNFRKYTFVVYNKDEATHNYLVTDDINNWGTLEGKTVPWNPAWVPNGGTDGQAIVLDATNGYEWNLWKINLDNVNHTMTIGNGNKCAGDYLTNNWDNPATKTTGSRGCGINYLAMLVRPWEIEKGIIEHALSMPIRGTSGSVYYAPATKLEHPGKVGAIPEGARFSLNTTLQEIDAYVNTLTGLRANNRRAIKIILIALKDYGWFITDTAGSSMLHFEGPESAQAAWEAIGVLPSQAFNGMEYPRFALRGFMAQAQIVAYVPSDQYPASAFE